MMDVERLLATVPACLRERPQWVCWKYENRDGKPTKVPIEARTGQRGSSTDPATWTSFEEAVAACRRYAALEGVGFVFSEGDPFCGIDLDGAVVDGRIAPQAQLIIDRFNTYTEISPSGRGVKLFLRGRKPERAGCRQDHVDGFDHLEVYDSKRFFTVTGDHVAGTPRTVEDRQAELDELCQRVWPPRVGRNGVPTSQHLLQPTERGNARGPRLDMAERERRCLAYVQKCPDAISGQGGHNATLRAACECIRFGLDEEAAWRVMRWFNAHKTGGEPWSEKELRHKLESARAKVETDGEVGARLAVLPPLYTYDEVARCFLRANDRMIYWRGEFHLYAGTCYRALTEAELGARIARFITDVGWWSRPARRDKHGNYEEGAVPHPDYDDLMVVVEKVIPRTAHVREILLQLKRDFLPDVVEAPCWLDGAGGPLADELVACRNGLLHLPAGQVHAHTERLFSLNAVDYDYNPSAPAPGAWLEFLHDLFEDDTESVETLQELFGYYLLPDTRQHKIGLIVGPKRSGKGTIARVLTGVLGRENVCGPTLGSLGTNFGLWPLLHKRLAIISDARLSGRTDQAVVVERLLSISGEDTITVDRKHLSPWTGRLPTRFLILTNELPKLTDSSGALASRFILLCLTRSWYGREAHELTDRLLGELPGILNWSIQGWRRLNERGHFVQPASSLEALQELEDLTSPIRAFVRERCEIGPGRQVEVETLYAAWQEYCGSTGRERSGTIQTFGRDLRAAFPTLRMVRLREGDGRLRCYEGIGLLPMDALVRSGPRSYSLHAFSS